MSLHARHSTGPGHITGDDYAAVIDGHRIAGLQQRRHAGDRHLDRNASENLRPDWVVDVGERAASTVEAMASC